MTTARRIGALAGFAALLAGCGGGGGSAPVTPVAVPSPAASPAATGKAIATATLTITYAADFSVAKKAAAAAARKAANLARKAGVARKPAYINASSGYTLDLFIDGTYNGPVTVNPENGTDDGTQTITIPLYSTSAHQIVAVETTSGYNAAPATVLAIGETDLSANSFTPGGAPIIGLTMVMNVATIGVTDDTTNSDESAQTGSGTWNDDFDDCGSYPQSGNIYLFAADPANGFVVNSGAGLANVNLTGWTTDPGASTANTLEGNNGVNPGQYVTFNSSYGIDITATAQNPAYAIYTDALTVYDNYYDTSPYTFVPKSYPGIEYLYIHGQLTNVMNDIIGTGANQSVNIDLEPSLGDC